ncbi:MAG: D-2-hydroxyacid dehydrogenase [Halobacteriaceae archaeon]
MPDVVVLNQKIHGMEPREYAAAIRERVDREVAYAATDAEARRLAADAPVVTGHTIDEALLDAASGLELFACTYAGTDHLPVDALRDRGAAVTNAAGVHGPNVAEHALGAVLAFARRFHEGWRRQRRREWRHYQARDLQGSAVAVVGMGAIGTAILERLDPFGVERLGVRYTPGKGGPAEEVRGFDGLDSVLARADYAVLACPLTAETRGLLGAEQFATLPPDAVVVNVARGAVVDTDALVAALRGNEVRGAALDVTDPEPLPEDHPLWSFGNVMLTPHNAGHTPEYWERRADILAENLARQGRDESLRNRVA